MNFIKKNIKYIILVIVCIVSSNITVHLSNNKRDVHEINDVSEIKLADTNMQYDSENVRYDNSESGIQSNNVRGAIDELYACASNFTTYDTRLQGVEDKVGSTTLNTTSQDLSSAINEVNGKMSTSSVWISSGETKNISITKNKAMVYLKLPQTSQLAKIYVLFVAKQNGYVNYVNLSTLDSSITIDQVGLNQMTISTTWVHGCECSTIEWD